MHFSLKKQHNYNIESFGCKKYVYNIFNVLQVANIKKTLKSTQQTDSEEQMVTDSRDIAMSSDKPKKGSKTKG